MNLVDVAGSQQEWSRYYRLLELKSINTSLACLSSTSEKTKTYSLQRF